MSGAGGTLDRYVLRRMAGIYGLCVVAFVLLFLVVDGVSRLDEFISSAKVIESQGRSVWGVAFDFYATKVPRIVSLVGPYMTLFAGIATLLSFARSNEIVPMLTAGRSIHRVLLPVYLFALAMAGVLVVFEERVVPYSIRENEMLDRLVKDKGKVEVSRIPHITDGPNRFSAGRWYPQEQRLSGLACQRYTDPTGVLPPGTLEIDDVWYRRNPRTGRVGWFPKGGVLTPSAAGPEGTTPASIRLPPDVPIAFSYTPADVGVLASSGEEGISRAQLLALQRRFPHEHKYVVDLQTRTTRPAASFVLLLLGIPFVASPEKRSVAWGLGLALFLCVAYFGADFLAREIAMRSEVNPVVAVWGPPILFTAVALAIMDRVTT